MTELTFYFMKQNAEDDKNAPVAPFEKMDACPFCGSDHLTIRSEDEFMWGHCRQCGATGSERKQRKRSLIA